MYTLIIICLISGSALGVPGKLPKSNLEKPEAMTANTLLPIPVFNIAASKVDFLNAYPSAYTIAELEPEPQVSQGFRKFFRIAGSPISKRPNFFNSQYAQIATYPTAVSRQSSTIVHDRKNAAISPLATYNQVFAAPELGPISFVPLPDRNNEIYLPLERFISPYSAAYASEFEFKPFIQTPVPITSPYAVKQQPCYPNGVIEPVIACA